MGYYINQDSKGNMLPDKGKLKMLVEDGAKVIPTPTKSKFEEGLVCIVDNGMFEAAGYAFSKEEMEVFLDPDNRMKTWIKYDKAKELAK